MNNQQYVLKINMSRYSFELTVSFLCKLALENFFQIFTGREHGTRKSGEICGIILGEVSFRPKRNVV
jgi:hypothetical protein